MKILSLLALLLLTACLPTPTPSPLRATSEAALLTIESDVHALGTSVGATETAFASTPVSDPLEAAWSVWGIAMYDRTGAILDAWHLCDAGRDPIYCIETGSIGQRAAVLEAEIAWGSPTGQVPDPNSGACGQGLRQLVLVLRQAKAWPALYLADLHMSLASGARECP